MNPSLKEKAKSAYQSLSKTTEDIASGFYTNVNEDFAKSMFGPEKKEQMEKRIANGEPLFSKEEFEKLSNDALNFGPGAIGSIAKKGAKPLLEKTIPEVFDGLKGLSTKLLEKFKGMPNEITPQQFNEVLNKAKKEGIKKADEDLVIQFAKPDANGKINLTKLGKDVETQLVPLTPTPVKSPIYSYVGQDFIGDGKYEEIIFQSPIKTSAGNIHFSKAYSTVNEAGGYPNYFSHVRREVLPDGKGNKYLEFQSDLMQKENFAKEGFNKVTITEGKKLLSETERARLTELERMNVYENRMFTDKELKEYDLLGNKAMDLVEKQNKISRSKLEPYNSNDPLAQLRTFREVIKMDAQAGKEYILVPAGETAMKIEGLGAIDEWRFINPNAIDEDDFITLTKDNLKVGENVTQGGTSNWVIAEVLGDGKFKAISKDVFEEAGLGSNYKVKQGDIEYLLEMSPESVETFDISGKVDTKHFVYKLNEDAIPKEARKMGLEVEKIGMDKRGNPQKIADQGFPEINNWWKIKLPKERGIMPSDAFAVAPLMFGNKNEEPEMLGGNYWIRNNKITDSDLNEAKAILFGEISDRPLDKQKLEAQTILNTAFNRMEEYNARGFKKRKDWTLTEVLQMDNQYQALGGKEYKKIKGGQATTTGDRRRIEAIDSMFDKVKDGTFQNNIGKSVFYVHKPDGRIIVDDRPLFK